MNAEFPNKSIGREGSTPCPVESPDLAKIDLFLSTWFIKNSEGYKGSDSSCFSKCKRKYFGKCEQLFIIKRLRIYYCEAGSYVEHLTEFYSWFLFLNISVN